MAQLRRYLKGVKNREFWAMYGKLIWFLSVELWNPKLALRN
jgi:hypothetical protein